MNQDTHLPVRQVARPVGEALIECRADSERQPELATGAWWSGGGGPVARGSLLCDSLYGLRESHHLLQVIRPRMQALTGSCALGAYRARHRQWPASKAELAKMGLPLAESLSWDRTRKNLRIPLSPAVLRRTQGSREGSLQTTPQGLSIQF